MSATAPAPARMPLATRGATKKTIQDVIQSDRVRTQVALAIPKHMDPDRMLRVMLTTVNGNFKLQKCSEASLLNALMKCSQYGLEPDGRHAHLIPYGEQVQLIFDYKGIVSLVRRSGEVSDIHCDVVYENDQFEFSHGVNGILYHKPALKGERGEPYYAYSFVKLKDGTPSYEGMRLDEILAVRDRSQGYQAYVNGTAKQSPWVDNLAEMCKKTAFKRHSKWLPFSASLVEAIHADDDPKDVDSARFRAAKPVFATPLTALPDLPQAEQAEAVDGEPEPLPVKELVKPKPDKRKPAPADTPAETQPADRPALVRLMELMDPDKINESEVLAIARRRNLADDGHQELWELTTDTLEAILRDWEVWRSQILIDRKGP